MRNRKTIATAVDLERRRQEELVEKNGWKSYQDKDDGDKFAVLIEEVGEVGKAYLEGDGNEVFKELIQVAAVASAWAEGILTELE